MSENPKNISDKGSDRAVKAAAERSGNEIMKKNLTACGHLTESEIAEYRGMYPPLLKFYREQNKEAELRSMNPELLKFQREENKRIEDARQEKARQQGKFIKPFTIIRFYLHWQLLSSFCSIRQNV